MQVVELTPADLPELGAMAYRLWGRECCSCAPENLRTIYHFLAGYYFHPLSPFKYGIREQGRLTAALLGAAPDDEENLAAAVLPAVSAGSCADDLARYRRYLEINCCGEAAAVQPGDVILLLFMSLIPGRGRVLMRHFSAAALAAGYRNMLLWTDTTCNHGWYPVRGFRQAAQFVNRSGIFPGDTTTWIYRKPL